MQWLKMVAMLLGSGGGFVAAKTLLKTQQRERKASSRSGRAESSSQEQHKQPAGSSTSQQVQALNGAPANQKISQVPSPTAVRDVMEGAHPIPATGRETRSAQRRGGRTLGSKNRNRKEENAAIHRRQPVEKPTLVCRLQGMAWVVAVEIPDDLDEDEPTVHQNSAILEKDPRPHGQWNLTQPLANVHISTANGVQYSIEGAPYRCFKLTGEHERGRLVEKPAAGQFRVIAPSNWKLIEPVGCSSDPVLGGACQAFFWDLSSEAATAIRFATPDGKCAEIHPCRPQFTLTGHRVGDNHRFAGPLFGPEPPRLECLSGATYRKIVAGEAGEAVGSKRWRGWATDYEQLCTTINERGAGWFFLRIYDERENLIDTLDFRFGAGLEAVELEPTPVVPGPEGHRPARVTFRHHLGLSIRPKIAGPQTAAVPQGTDAYLPADPECDSTSWIISVAPSRQVELQLRLNRVWWALCEIGPEPSSGQWTDRPVPPLRAQDLRAASILVLWLKGVRGATQTAVGFNYEHPRVLNVAVHQDEVPFRLGDLVEAEQLSQPGTWPLKLWIERSGGRPQSCVVAEVIVPKPEPAMQVWRLAEPRHLIRLLQAVARSRPQPFNRLVRQFRRQHYLHGGRTKGRPKDFFASGLCLLALMLDRSQALLRSPCIKQSWRKWATESRIQNPAIFRAWEKAYQRLQPLGTTKQFTLTKAAGR